MNDLVKTSDKSMLTIDEKKRNGQDKLWLQEMSFKPLKEDNLLHSLAGWEACYNWEN